LSEILPSSGLVPGLDEVGQKGQNYCFYDVTHNKCNDQNQTDFFSLRTRRLAKSFVGLNSSLAQSAKELWTWKDSCKLLC